MSARTVNGGDLTPEQRRVLRVEHILRRDGGSPGSALEGLAAIVEEELWRKVPSVSGEPFGSFREFVEAHTPFGLGYSSKQLTALLQLQHPHEKQKADVRERMQAMRRSVQELMKDSNEPASEHGGNRRSADIQVGGTSLKANGVDYVVARLKRDDPELADRVVRGELTANAAARQAGIRKPRIVLTSPQSIARALRQNLDDDAIAELIELLQQT